MGRDLVQTWALLRETKAGRKGWLTISDWGCWNCRLSIVTTISDGCVLTRENFIGVVHVQGRLLEHDGGRRRITDWRPQRGSGAIEHEDTIPERDQGLRTKFGKGFHSNKHGEGPTPPAVMLSQSLYIYTKLNKNHKKNWHPGLKMKPSAECTVRNGAKANADNATEFGRTS